MNEDSFNSDNDLKGIINKGNDDDFDTIEENNKNNIQKENVQLSQRQKKEEVNIEAVEQKKREIHGIK